MNNRWGKHAEGSKAFVYGGRRIVVYYDDCSQDLLGGERFVSVEVKHALVRGGMAECWIFRFE